MSHEPPSADRARLHWTVRLGAELVVVFLGVWSAFLLDGCREERAAETRREQIHELLADDLAEVSVSLERGSTWFETTFVEGFLEPYEAGERPLLQPIPIPATSPDDGWNAMVASGSLADLDLELIRAVESFLAASIWITSSATEYNASVRTILVPEWDERPSVETFYDSESGRLRGKYLWYYYSLQSIRSGFEQVERQAGELQAIIDDRRGAEPAQAANGTGDDR